MKIYHIDANNTTTIQRNALKAFCPNIQIPLSALELLEIRFVIAVPGKPQARADFRGSKTGPSLIHLRTLNDHRQRFTIATLNFYLLHEMWHFRDFCLTGRCYAPGEWKLPHNERPAEIAANAFAAYHQQRQQLLILRSQVTTLRKAS